MFFHVIPSISTCSSFHLQTQSPIKLADFQTLQQEWLENQSKLKRYDISVLTKQSISDILKYFQIETVLHDLNRPTYNPYHHNFLCQEFKNPPSGLLGVYLKPRINPFNEKYPAKDNEYTLEDLLKYEIAIEEAFVFWDVHQQPPLSTQANVEVILINHFIGQSKEELINHYLIQNQIINEPKLIKLGCYNPTPTNWFGGSFLFRRI
ncbi:hypothetical protein OC716_02110 [Candidatus Phytoplasma aurantifolia]|uniref:hypothetical protein n=1 Tax=Candidatus Phytoplasma citri TaxID=180978 RepID=UPI00271222BC|nr:hypothetical protein [Candidatus Phytoplasma aurantifolia]